MEVEYKFEAHKDSMESKVYKAQLDASDASFKSIGEVIMDHDQDCLEV